MILQIITHTPLYVWFLLAYLIWGGWKARKTSIVPWKALLIMPLLLFAFSVYINISRYGHLSSICLSALSMSLGIWLGSLTLRKTNLRFDKRHHLIEIEGSYSPLLLSISIFALRYFLGAAYGLHPDLAANNSLLLVECLATVVSGMFTGRLIGYWQRYKISPHIDLETS